MLLDLVHHLLDINILIHVSIEIAFVMLLYEISFGAPPVIKAGNFSSCNSTIAGCGWGRCEETKNARTGLFR